MANIVKVAEIKFVFFFFILDKITIFRKLEGQMYT